MVALEPATLDLSAVVPVFDEAENVGPLIAELKQAFDATGRVWEAILVDDASTDGSGARIQSEARVDARIRTVRLGRRGGQSAALTAGLALARGRVIVTLDADLQNDPADLPKLLASLENADVASGVRAERHDSTLRKLSSRIANAARRAVLGDSLTDIGCSFKAYRREALRGLPTFSGVHRFLPALCEFRGARLVEVPVHHRPRRHGKSKYGVHDRLWRGIHDLVGVRWLKSRLLPSSTWEVDP